MRDRLYTKAVEFSKRYADTELHCDTNIRATFFTLRDLVVFFDAYHEQKYELALETLNKLNLVPLNVNELEKCVNNFKRFVDCASRSVLAWILTNLLISDLVVKSAKYSRIYFWLRWI